ncbi:MAG: hypothetical protein H7Y11_07325, partial [Armatimonadetes bacterium]|nr:hypothetical protein [Anaerolineae bacterium]
MKQTTSFNLPPWLRGALLFAMLQVFLFGLGFLVKFTRGQARPGLGEAIIGSEQNDDY